MSQNSRQETLGKLRRSYARAGQEYKAKLLDYAVDVLGYHRKAAIVRWASGQPPRKL